MIAWLLFKSIIDKGPIPLKGCGQLPIRVGRVCERVRVCVRNNGRAVSLMWSPLCEVALFG